MRYNPASTGHAMTEFGHELTELAPWIHHYGVAAVFVILTLESLGLPLPGESLLVIASVLAGRGEISLLGLILAAWAGAVLGDNIGYLGGRILGRGLSRRYGGRIGLTADRLSKIEAVFARYGPMTVIFARFFSVLRQLNGIIAGTMKMDWRQFLFLNALGGALWVSAWVAAGFCLASYRNEHHDRHAQNRTPGRAGLPGRVHRLPRLRLWPPAVRKGTARSSVLQPVSPSMRSKVGQDR